MVPRLQLHSIGTTMLPGSMPCRWRCELEIGYEFNMSWPEKWPRCTLASLSNRRSCETGAIVNSALGGSGEDIQFGGG